MATPYALAIAAAKQELAALDARRDQLAAFITSASPLCEGMLALSTPATEEARPSAPRPTSASPRTADEAAVLAALARHPEPLSVSAVGAFSKVPRWKLKGVLKTLCASGQIRLTGATVSRRVALA